MLIQKRGSATFVPFRLHENYQAEGATSFFFFHLVFRGPGKYSGKHRGRLCVNTRAPPIFDQGGEEPCLVIVVSGGLVIRLRPNRAKKTGRMKILDIPANDYRLENAMR